MGAGMMVELEGLSEMKQLLAGEHGWTMMTAVSVMLFSLLHNPYSTTIMTIRQETKSWKWTAVATFLPLAIVFTVLFLLNLIVR